MPWEYVITGLAALAAGIINSLAGGGSFLTFPSLMAAGLTPINSNATSTVALFPGQASSILGARSSIEETWKTDKTEMKWLAAISLVNGGLGALLLLATPDRLFASLVPWLLLVATTIFAIGTVLPKSVERPLLRGKGIYLAHALISLYGGYFGGGIGILMLAAFTLYGWHDIRKMNAIKILMAWIMNVAAVVAFVIANRVHWDYACIMGVHSIIGGWIGAKLNGIIPPIWVRIFVISVGVLLTFWYFYK